MQLPMPQIPSEPIPQPAPIHQLAPIPRSAPVQNHPPVLPLSIDPNDRPIKPMKDTSIYNNPPSLEKNNQPKKPLSPLKPIQSSSRGNSGTFQLPPKPVRSSPHNQSDRLQSALKPVRSSPHNQFDRIQSASKPVPVSPFYKHNSHSLPPSRTRMNNVSARRPINPNIKTLFDDNPPPPPRNQRHQILQQGYNDGDNNYPVQYIRSAPKRMISYQEGPFITREEMHNYQIPQTRRIVRVRPSPPVKTIIYRT